MRAGTGLTAGCTLLLLLLTLISVAGAGPGPRAPLDDRTLWRVPLDAATIQAAVDSASVGDTVEVASGIYQGPGNRDIRFGGKEIVVRSQTGNPEDCTIDCEGTPEEWHRGFALDGEEGPGTVVEGFTITGGYGGDDIGGCGIVVRWGQVAIRDCIFRDNSGLGAGGVQITDTSDVVVDNCLFENNTAVYYGGGCVVERSVAVLRNCEFVGNFAGQCGGGLCTYNAAFTVDSCVFVENRSANGGGLCDNVPGPNRLVRQCTFYKNSAPQGGAIVVSNNGSLVVENSIISYSTVGCAVACVVGSSASLSCCDAYGNAGGDWVNCIAGQMGSNGNISADPMFCDAAAGDFTLDATSPCAPDQAPAGCGLIGALGVGCSQAGVETVTAAAGELRLEPLVPNPFKQMTEITYAIPAGAGASRVTLEIFDVQGRQVRSLVASDQASGVYRAVWDGKGTSGESVAGGIYFCRLTWNGQSETRSIVLSH